MSRSLMTEATAQQLLTELRAIREEVEEVRRHLTTSLDAKSALRIWLAAFDNSRAAYSKAFRDDLDEGQGDGGRYVAPRLDYTGLRRGLHAQRELIRRRVPSL